MLKHSCKCKCSCGRWKHHLYHSTKWMRTSHPTPIPRRATDYLSDEDEEAMAPVERNLKAFWPEVFLRPRDQPEPVLRRELSTSGKGRGAEWWSLCLDTCPQITAFIYIFMSLFKIIMSATHSNFLYFHYIIVLYFYYISMLQLYSQHI